MFPHHFRGNLVEVVTKIGDQFVEIFRSQRRAQTVIHGDYRIDNMLLPIVDGQTRLLQWIGRTLPAVKDHDLAYFASQSCGPRFAERKKWKRSRSTTAH